MSKKERFKRRVFSFRKLDTVEKLEASFKEVKEQLVSEKPTEEPIIKRKK